MFNLGRPGEGTDKTEAEVAGDTQHTGRESSWFAQEGRNWFQKVDKGDGDKSGAESLQRGDDIKASAAFNFFSKYEYYKQG